MTMSLEQEPPPELVGAPPSPFRSLSLVLKGFCDPDAGQEDDDDDDAYPPKDVQPQLNGSSGSRNVPVVEKVKEAEQNVMGRTRRAIFPDAASTKVLETKNTETKITETKVPESKITETKMPETKIKETKPELKITEAKMQETKIKETKPESKITETKMPETKIKETKPESKITETKIPETKITETKVPETKITENPRQETVTNQSEEYPVTKSNQTRSAPIVTEIPKPDPSSSKNSQNCSEPTKKTPRSPPKEAFDRGLNIHGETLPSKKNESTKVVPESGTKKRTSSIVKILFFSLFAVAVMIYCLLMLKSSSPISIGIQNTNMDEAHQTEDPVYEEHSGKATNYKPDDEEETTESIDNEPKQPQESETVNEESETSYHQKMDDPEPIDDEPISTQEEPKESIYNEETDDSQTLDNEPISIQVQEESEPIHQEPIDAVQDSVDDVDAVAEDNESGEEKSDEL